MVQLYKGNTSKFFFHIFFKESTATMVFQLILPYWVIIFVVFIASFYWRWSRSRFVRLVNVLPGPRTLPLIGNALEFIHLDKEGSYYRKDITKKKKVIIFVLIFRTLNETD